MGGVLPRHHDLRAGLPVARHARRENVFTKVRARVPGWSQLDRGTGINPLGDLAGAAQAKAPARSVAAAIGAGPLTSASAKDSRHRTVSIAGRSSARGHQRRRLRWPFGRDGPCSGSGRCHRTQQSPVPGSSLASRDGRPLPADITSPIQGILLAPFAYREPGIIATIVARARWRSSPVSAFRTFRPGSCGASPTSWSAFATGRSPA